MNKGKIVALVALVLGAVATAVSASAWGANPNVHTACDVVVKVLMALGLTAPVSALGGASPAKPPLTLVPPAKEQP